MYQHTCDEKQDCYARAYSRVGLFNYLACELQISQQTFFCEWCVPDQLQTQITVNVIYSSRVNKHIKWQEGFTPFIDIDHPFYCENESKISLVLRVSEKEYLVIAEFKLFSARYKDGKFT